jgi:SAM-dependent methyltransferase
VLDVGSGDKPHWRADVLLDRYTGAEHGGQRSGRAAARITRPLFAADAADMPFADGVFDYVVCSHVLEHVPDPAAVIAEITRVGRAGYIEVPQAASAKILDFPSHLWWCRLDGSTLVFTAKHARAFDPEIAGYIERSGVERELERLLDRAFDYRIVSLRWNETIDVRIEGSLDPLFEATARSAETQHRPGQTLGGRLLTATMALPHWRHRRSAPVLFDDIVKPELRIGTGERLQKRLYCLPSSVS